MNMKQSCIFCRIVAGKLHSYKVYEDEDSLAFLDINPLTEGHTLVIPKEHYEKLEAMPKDKAGKLFEAVRLVTGKVQKAMDTSSSTIGINNGRLAGQAIPHVHVHIIPRYPGDGGGMIHSIVRKPTKRSLEEIKKAIEKGF